MAEPCGIPLTPQPLSLLSPLTCLVILYIAFSWISSHGNVDETLLFEEIYIEHAGLAMKQALTCKTIYSDGFFEVDRSEQKRDMKRIF